MARPRADLQQILLGLCDNVYFQPPNGVQMEYPAIVYRRDFEDAGFADNVKYRHMRRYQVTVIDRNPDSEIPDQVGMLPLCTFNRFFTANNLNHDVYNLFF